MSVEQKTLLGFETIDWHVEALRMAFELGYRACEEGLNLQAANIAFEQKMKEATHGRSSKSTS